MTVADARAPVDGGSGLCKRVRQETCSCRKEREFQRGTGVRTRAGDLCRRGNTPGRPELVLWKRNCLCRRGGKRRPACSPTMATGEFATCYEVPCIAPPCLRYRQPATRRFGWSHVTHSVSCANRLAAVQSTISPGGNGHQKRNRKVTAVWNAPGRGDAVALVGT
jgi:hypothetical protein